MLCYLFDLDGTLIIEGKTVEYAVEFFEYLKSKRYEIFIVTNGSAISPNEMYKKLKSKGIVIEKDKLITSACVLKTYLEDNYKNARVNFIGAQWLKDYLIELGFSICDRGADVVVTSYSEDISMKSIENGIADISMGVDFISTNNDLFIPGNGIKIPHTGAVNSLISNLTGKIPHIIGKPSEYFMKKIKKISQSSEFCIVGDNIDTDIMFGKNSNISTYLIKNDFTDINSVRKVIPDKIFDSLGDLYMFIKKQYE